MTSNLQDSIVLITSSELNNSRFGTGFIVYQDELTNYLITCAHVVDDVGGLEQVRASSIIAKVIAIGTKNYSNVYTPDLAVLTVQGLAVKPPLTLSISGQKGSSFTTAGFQLFNKDCLIRPLQGTLGEQVGLESRVQATRIKAWDLKINDDFDLQPGYSGSPVVDQFSGSVLGVVSHRLGQGKGVAISVEALQDIWKTMPFNLSQLKQEENLSPIKVSRKNKRLQKKLETLNHEWELRNSLIQDLREALLYENDPTTKIKLKKQIEEREAKLEELETDIEQIERKIQGI